MIGVQNCILGEERGTSCKAAHFKELGGWHPTAMLSHDYKLTS